VLDGDNAGFYENHRLVEAFIHLSASSSAGKWASSFSPDGALSYFGLDGLRADFRPWIGVVFLISAGVLLTRSGNRSSGGKIRSRGTKAVNIGRSGFITLLSRKGHSSEICSSGHTDAVLKYERRGSSRFGTGENHLPVREHW